MDSNYLHLFLEKILATGRCPSCNERISIRNIQIKSTTDLSCLFEIHCDTCKAHSVAQAVINVLPGPNAPADYTPKLSAPVEIEAEEVEHLEQLLEGSSPHNLTSLFLTHE